MEIFENCLQIRGKLVHCHALLGKKEITLIDGGFLGDAAGRIAHALEKKGRGLEEVSRIFLTHGHIDHTLQIARLKELTSAQVYAPVADKLHIEARYPYRGVSRICNELEQWCRVVFRYQIPEIDHWFTGDDEFPEIWGGMRVIGLPGHTNGHCGFYFEEKKLLFAADLFSNFRHRVKLPPPWFNVNRAEIIESLQKVNSLDLEGGVIINHSRSATPAENRKDLQHLADKYSKK